MAQIPRALPLHMQPPPSVPKGELAQLGIQYLSCTRVRDMLYARNQGRLPFAIVDLRDDDFVGGHIPGCDHIASRRFYNDIDGAITSLKWAPLVVFHCLISMHRAPMCAKLYKERIRQLGIQQDVAILEGGFSQWREQFSGQRDLMEDETLDGAAAQRQFQQGFGLGEQFVADVRNGGGGSPVRPVYGGGPGYGGGGPGYGPGPGGGTRPVTTLFTMDGPGGGHRGGMPPPLAGPGGVHPTSFHSNSSGQMIPFGTGAAPQPYYGQPPMGPMHMGDPRFNKQYGGYRDGQDQEEWCSIM